MRLLLTAIIVMFAGMAQAYTMTHMRGDGKTGTVLVQGMENYDAALATWTNGQCPDDNSWSEILDLSLIHI